MRKYVAGFFDAEGTVGFKVRDWTKTIAPRLLICQEPIDQEYVAGFFDGDGLVQLDVNKGKTYKIGHEVTPRIKITNARGDVIEEIKKWCKSHGIVAHTRVDKRGHRLRPLKILTINRLESVKKFCMLIYPYLRVKREQVRILLFEIIPRLERGRHKTKEGFIEVMEFVDRVNSLKGGRRRNKYTADYFRKLWSHGIYR